MVIFARMFNMTGAADLSVFKDANKVSDWAKEGVQAVVASGLINGDQGYLKPKAAITRAEIATIATRALDY
ncbi:MAG: S-layer homology domain-containing protein [Clostridia bacterium]|nr:S-layer homology domain-containing protein [Clostridia bacterium]